MRERKADMTIVHPQQPVNNMNPEDVFYDNLKRDIDAFAAREQSIRTSKVCSSNDVRYAIVNGDEVAYVTAYYFQKEGNDLFKTYQVFCLRKDDEQPMKLDYDCIRDVLLITERDLCAKDENGTIVPSGNFN